ncbi:Protein CBG12242, partial [Caenorhabditis briggsae]
LATRQVKEAAPTEKTKSFSEKKTTKINFSIGWSSDGRKEGERQRKDGVQRARRQKNV